MKNKLILFVAALLFSGAMYAQDVPNSHFMPSGWDYHSYAGPMSIIGQVYFNDEIQNNANLEIASFVGEEFRGSVMLMEPFPNVPDLGYFAYLPCYFDSPGETFTFKAYDHATGKEYDVCTTTAIGNEDGYGEVDYPFDFHFTVEEEPTYGPEYPWEPSTLYDGNGMLVTAQVQINGQLVDRATYEVGAFCGEECRGTSGTGLDDWTDVELGYFAFMNIMGNDDDIINFYLYDLENNEICPVTCYTTVTLENDGELGIDIMGGDIFVLNFVMEQTFTKDITAYNGDGGWYFIASPVNEDITPSADNGFITNDYDLYYFNQDGDSEGNEWINWKNNGALNGFDIENGKGYLYASGTNTTLLFTGTAYSGNGEVELTYSTTNPDANMHGWNLVGNPFAQSAYIEVPFYTLDGGSDYEEHAAGDEIEYMQGVLVKATAATTLTFSTEVPSKSANITLNISKDRAIIDRAIVSFGKGEQLPKIQLKENNTKVYIPMDNKDYAVVNANGDGEMPVSFKAQANGSYTINVTSQDIDFRYLHLIDNLTGADVDLLANPSYSFNALTTDYASRFKLVFITGQNDDNFVFFSNGNWIIDNDGEAVLQVIDINGRILSSEQISGCASKHIDAAPGVYMMRLINGDNVKVQKIVVR